VGRTSFVNETSDALEATAMTTPADFERIVATADSASRPWSRRTATDRAAALRAVADDLDTAAGTLIPIAQDETHLPTARLTSELTRTTFQLRLHADEIETGRPFDPRIDHADPTWGMGPRPDLRRIGIPVGPVVVFAAGNFPFAFSVAGGDTSSALAAGCPVVLKAHPGHPRLSDATADVVRTALQTAGAPTGLFGIIHGDEAGRAAVLDPRIAAGAFTGSIAGGRALFDLAASRPVPIPFFGELGSVNPVFVTRAAATRRPEEIAAGFVGSFTLGAGQFCTKPGLLFVPSDSDVPRLLADHAELHAQPLLNDRIQAGYGQSLTRLRTHREVRPLTSAPDGPHGEPGPVLLTTPVTAVLADPGTLLEECFGPAALVVTYDDEQQLLVVAEHLPGQLTATIVGELEDDIAPALIELASERAGRVLWNQWPTGVSVTHAQQHGGPYPATTAPATTSVGTAAISRFLRPVAYQGLPERFLPALLQDPSQGRHDV
jgi:NADP-dependent aldehyde dehydrogenase